MNIIRYQVPSLLTPAAPVSDLRDEMERLFDIAFPTLSRFQRGGGWAQEIPLDMFQDKDAFYARLEVPGFSKENLSLEVENGVVTVTAHLKTEAKAEKSATTQEQRVTRSFAVPNHADVERISARQENGVLTITLPKREESKPRQITVHHQRDAGLNN